MINTANTIALANADLDIFQVSESLALRLPNKPKNRRQIIKGIAKIGKAIPIRRQIIKNNNE
jgi:hypothetical protein